MLTPGLINLIIFLRTHFLCEKIYKKFDKVHLCVFLWKHTQSLKQLEVKGLSTGSNSETSMLTIGYEPATF